MTVEFAQVLWFYLIGVSLFMFSVLDGFDLGVGMLLPFYTKSDSVKNSSIGSIWPVWDGNELWGIIAGGALIAIFPLMFTRLVSGMYPYVILLLAAVMYRPIAFEMIFHGGKNKARWQMALAISSFFIPLLVGAVIGNTIFGFNLNPDGTIAGGIFAVLNPFSILTALLVIGMFLVHGANWLIVKLDGQGQNEATAALKKLWFIPLVLFIAWEIWVMTFSGAGSRPIFWISGVLLLGGFVLNGLLSGRKSSDGNQRIILLTSAANIALWWINIAAIQFPILVRSRVPGVADMTISNAGGRHSTLVLLGWLVPIVVVIVLAYTIFVYSIYKGKVKDATPEEGGIGY